MGTVKILADSCCDLSDALLVQYDVSLIPLYVSLGETVYRDRVNIDSFQIFDYFNRTKETPKTSAPTVGDFVDFFKPYADAGQDIVYISISTHMSTTHQNARIAAESYPHVQIFCVDSGNLSTGIGLLVLRAAEMAQERLSAAEIADQVTALVPQVRASFILEQLDYLHRGGRCSLLSLLGAQVLGIKPEIAVQDGAMFNRTKFRGSLISVAQKYVAGLLQKPQSLDRRRAFVTYPDGTDAAVIDTVYRLAVESGCFDEVLKTHAGGVITSHCGRNCIGLLFIENA